MDGDAGRPPHRLLAEASFARGRGTRAPSGLDSLVLLCDGDFSFAALIFVFACVLGRRPGALNALPATPAAH